MTHDEGHIPGAAPADGYTRPLADLRHADAARFGGKSASLGELMAAGIPVPPGFAVSTSAFEAFLEAGALAGTIADAIAGVAPDDVEALQAASATIMRAMCAAPVPAGVRAEIADRYAQLASQSGEAEPAVAVRSSAIGEDSAEATFAGQQETYLWVRGADAVCDAVRDCWASLHSPPAMAYRARLAAIGQEPAMGVAVQLMVDAEVSGVMFTCNPVSGDPSIVAINASWGLGLGVVGGEVTPDEYLLSKVTGEVVRETISAKHIEYRPDPSGRGTVRADVEPARQEQPCLDETARRALVDVAQRVQKYFGSHQDVEWAIARGSEAPAGLHVVQSRPVTATGATAAAGAADPNASALSLVMGTFGAGQRKPSPEDDAK
ncbi:MAG TPA: PEP/pyruvate-binding domain-containing protein [Solirubrobacteraceae bacterium]|nr:PEP/pyruvate-binding domain-containing protein [Solirubrobacteraceae bacterium]